MPHEPRSADVTAVTRGGARPPPCLRLREVPAAVLQTWHLATLLSYLLAPSLPSPSCLAPPMLLPPRRWVRPPAAAAPLSTATAAPLGTAADRCCAAALAAAVTAAALPVAVVVDAVDCWLAADAMDLGAWSSPQTSPSLGGHSSSSPLGGHPSPSLWAHFPRSQYQKSYSPEVKSPIIPNKTLNPI